MSFQFTPSMIKVVGGQSSLKVPQVFNEPFNVGWTGAGAQTDPVFMDPADFSEPFTTGWTDAFDVTFNPPDLTFGPESFEPDWDDIPPNPQFDPPDLTFGPEGFEPDWDDIPPNPQFNPPDISFTEQFDASWDGVP